MCLRGKPCLFNTYKASVYGVSVMRGNAIRQEKEIVGRVAY